MHSSSGNRGERNEKKSSRLGVTSRQEIKSPMKMKIEGTQENVYVENNYNETSNPVELFYKFVDDKIADLLVAESNNYANGKNLKEGVCHDKLRTFVGVLLLSGYVSVARRKLYWQNAPDTNNVLVTAAISRDRFTFIMSNIHCTSNNNLDENNDKFAKNSTFTSLALIHELTVKGIKATDMAIQNTWQIHRLQNGKFGQLASRRSVATGILETHKNQLPTPHDALQVCMDTQDMAD
ncbi:hypothetical protein ILUMI_04616 [Ignelater luminosus]|uniref:PiggyBac transposable element-derived protein domain-containing protein n=1 Tax=Ignelater luminosus TaxID=2038154 RepID=A0A8K0DJE2_IGNLU|nr:hypothetical protein ILUMI_04616 [Ignelater luminosus]